MAKTTQIFENVTIEDFAAEGKCIARIDGQVVFVEQAAPGDVVDLEIFGKRKKFRKGFPIHFHKESEKRQEAFCSHFGICGGCKWQHIKYEHQLAFKKKQVIDQLERIGKLDLPEVPDVIGSDNTEHYRNKLEFTFSNRRWLTSEQLQAGDPMENPALGFHVPGRFDKIIDIDTCYLQPGPSNEIRLFVGNYAKEHGLSFYDFSKHEGFLRNLIIRNSSKGEVMVIVQFGYEDEQIGKLCNSLDKAFDLTSVNYVINTKKNETFFDLEVVNTHGLPYIEEVIPKYSGSGELTFRIGPKTFFQTNTVQATKLYKTALDFAHLSGTELVYDLYSGIGTIAQFAAEKAKHVIGLESIEEAVVSARENAVLNNITNTDFHAGDIKDLLSDSFISTHGQPDVVITDPPRAGMHPKVVEQLNRVSPEKIVYVSCNPATQARDLELLSTNYKVVKVQPVDMFPHTHHVENVVLLELRRQ